jgi:hypothetical protein
MRLGYITGRPGRAFSAIALAVLAVGGCASITAGTGQSVAVSTTPEAGAHCNLQNEKGQWEISSTPSATTVHKAYGPLTVTCESPAGWKGSQSVESNTAGAAFGNILFGGVIGAAVDMGSGAAYKYPPTITVALSPPGVPARPTPAAPVLGGEQPAIIARDETRPAGAVICRIDTLTLAQPKDQCLAKGGVVVAPIGGA